MAIELHLTTTSLMQYLNSDAINDSFLTYNRLNLSQEDIFSNQFVLFTDLETFGVVYRFS